jgi:hypothetical protein
VAEPCLIWTGSKNRGYGNRRYRGGFIYVHRLAWEEAYGPIPDGMQVCHHCDTPACYEITHLFLGTMKDNMQDAKAKGRLACGAANARSKLTLEAAREIRATVRRDAGGVYRGVRAAARKYGVTDGPIRQLLRGDSWREVPRG